MSAHQSGGHANLKLKRHSQLRRSTSHLDLRRHSFPVPATVHLEVLELGLFASRQIFGEGDPVLVAMTAQEKTETGH